ncbi:MAG: carbonic anhydrase family protein [Lautropia sp.]|nr:carbonic anhydrase family protein [Lautropia sp.]
MTFPALATSLLIAFSSAPLLAHAADADTHHHPHWSYQGEESPLHWGELSAEYADCSRGKNQSPVDFTEAEGTQGGRLHLQYKPTRFSVINNGHTIQATPADGVQSLQIGTKQFRLRQFHFHTPSEHTFKGKHFPMEVHLVHQSDEGELAVLGAVFKEGPANPALTGLLAQPVLPGKRVHLNTPLKLEDLLPKSSIHFRLNGSLTTPPCSEGVNWVVFSSPVPASAQQIEAMHKMIGQDNARPIQPLNARIIIQEDN